MVASIINKSENSAVLSFYFVSGDFKVYKPFCISIFYSVK